jgi:hypothetical protein
MKRGILYGDTKNKKNSTEEIPCLSGSFFCSSKRKEDLREEKNLINSAIAFEASKCFSETPGRNDFLFGVSKNNHL